MSKVTAYMWEPMWNMHNLWRKELPELKHIRTFALPQKATPVNGGEFWKKN